MSSNTEKPLNKWTCTKLWFSPYKENVPLLEFNVWIPPDCSDDDHTKLLEKTSSDIVTIIRKLMNVELIVQSQFTPIVTVCGSKNWDNYDIIYNRLSKLPKNTIIIEGGYLGADLQSRTVAMDLELEVIEFPSPWEEYTKYSGPDKLLYNYPYLVIAFHNNIENSNGTKRIITEAKKRGIEVEVIMGDMS